MKKNMVSLLALIIAVGSFAFTSVDRVDYHWYKHNGTSFVFDRFGSAPTTPCSKEVDPCNRGFLVDPPNPNTATPNVEQFKNDL